MKKFLLAVMILVPVLVTAQTTGKKDKYNTGNTNTNSGTNSGNTNSGNTSSGSNNPLNSLGNMLGGGGAESLTNEEIVGGLTEALKIGINKASSSASKVDGYYKNPLIFIPFPKEVEIVKTTVEKVGMQKQVDEFVKSMNRAAETAAKESAPIFLDALKQMTITDGLNILKGKDDAATQYLRSKTYQPLKQKFTPVVNTALAKTGVNKLWTPIFETYNKVPFVQKVNPDLNAYVTEKALDGLFKLVGEEEKKIRKDPAGWGSNLINKVFGSVL